MKQENKHTMVLLNIFGNVHAKREHHGVVEEIKEDEHGAKTTKLKGCTYEFKGFPDGRIVKQLETTKKMSWFMADTLKSKWILALVAILYIFKRKKLFIKTINRYFEIAYRPLDRFNYILNEKQYCPAMSELYRVSEIMINDEKDPDLRVVFQKLRDIALMVLEFDTAYRFKVQDVLGMKDIYDIIDLIEEREQCGDQKKKWNRIRKLVKMVLRLKRVRKQVNRFFELLDTDKTKLDEADWYFCYRRSEYDYGGLTITDRLVLVDKIDKEKGHDLPEIELPKYDTKMINKLIK